MTVLVLDASVTLAWCLPEQRTPYAQAALAAVAEGFAVVPGLWALEVGNVLTLAQRRGVLSAEQVARFLEDLGELPTQVEHHAPEAALGAVRKLAERCRLTTYDACYLELALRLDLPLATQDEALAEATRSAGASLYAPPVVERSRGEGP